MWAQHLQAEEREDRVTSPRLEGFIHEQPQEEELPKTIPCQGSKSSSQTMEAQSQLTAGSVNPAGASLGDVCALKTVLVLQLSNSPVTLALLMCFLHPHELL